MYFILVPACPYIIYPAIFWPDVFFFNEDTILYSDN